MLKVANETVRSFDKLIQYYVMEGFLYRFSRSSHAYSFILKGALLFRVWNTPDSRATRDIDFSGHVDNSLDNMADIARDICVVDVRDDGLVFDGESVKARHIREGSNYEGVQIRFKEQLGLATS